MIAFKATLSREYPLRAPRSDNWRTLAHQGRQAHTLEGSGRTVIGKETVMNLRSLVSVVALVVGVPTLACSTPEDETSTGDMALSAMSDDALKAELQRLTEGLAHESQRTSRTVAWRRGAGCARPSPFDRGENELEHE